MFEDVFNEYEDIVISFSNHNEIVEFVKYVNENNHPIKLSFVIKRAVELFDKKVRQNFALHFFRNANGIWAAAWEDLTFYKRRYANQAVFFTCAELFAPTKQEQITINIEEVL